ncbi:MAG: peptidylprolyl isomerase [Xanthomonadales bacterium]|nr:peptidylprolyl isomerase [Xanthomonadales bacterium]
MRILRYLAITIMAVGAAQAGAEPFTCTVDDPVYPDVLFPQVEMETSLGRVVVELDRRRAPVTVNNFLAYVESGRYNGTLFHRVIDAFVVQGGGYLPGWKPIETRPPIINESGNGLRNEIRTVAMARYDDPHSATSQFFFNLADNDSLDPSRRNWGYTVFGRVIEGWEIIEALGAVPTDYSEALNAGDVPLENVVLRKVALIEQ